MNAPDRKAALRREMRQRLAAHPLEDSERRSKSIVDQLTALPDWQTMRRVLLFAPLPSEPDLDLLWAAGKVTDKECAYPRVDGSTLALYPVHGLADLKPNSWSVREPSATGDALPASDFDLILVPGLAFTPDERRLGRGGGFYDRLLAIVGPRPLTIGVAFRFQIVDDLPSEPHDHPVDQIITD